MRYAATTTSVSGRNRPSTSSLLLKPLPARTLPCPRPPLSPSPWLPLLPSSWPPLPGPGQLLGARVGVVAATMPPSWQVARLIMAAWRCTQLAAMLVLVVVLLLLLLLLQELLLLPPGTPPPALNFKEMAEQGAPHDQGVLWRVTASGALKPDLWVDQALAGRVLCKSGPQGGWQQVLQLAQESRYPGLPRCSLQRGAKALSVGRPACASGCCSSCCRCCSC